MVRALVAMAAVGFAGCVRAPPPVAVVVPPPELPDPGPPPTVQLLSPDARGLDFEVIPTSAAIVVDGVPRGTVADLAPAHGLLPLKPGIYQVSLAAEGYVTWRAEVAVGEKAEVIRVSLQKSP